MLGKVAIEEAINPPSELHKQAGMISRDIHPDHEDEYRKQVTSIEDRERRAARTGVGYTINSHVSPGIQAERDPAVAEKLAVEINDWMYNQIKDRRDTQGAFAALSMHDPANAAKELRRCVTQYGFHGALLNNWQLANNPDGSIKFLFYDQPEYDIFWETLQELDVPLYLHPAPPAGPLHDIQYAQRPYLMGPPASFSNDVSLHLLGMVSNGVFDRFPKVQVILGHLGERIVFDTWRINHWLEDVKKPRGLNKTCKKTIRQYFRDNIWVSTSGNFSTTSLQYVISIVGADRVLFAVDYPQEAYEDACGWFDNAEINLSDKLKIGKENAKRLFRLGKYRDSESGCDF
ncbi:hypothetical protein DTO166G4_2526 [Paecilomyces variotii]|uniref:Amidohydrolase family protein n=1 Tax=Byssochlamys spectabilis TaxID=264951 RepID=A0A443HLU0_BYSSP|nr:amidohydrolase family protein [Paecilomyces variotii]KAJ9190781.1 hypothetical protein DTO032I3_9160 [Paecilomyces variotii]KAJ9215982.1 hypothetical protein DTO166G4_2526 [Paecilomyces variotii]KAJ9222432.1 hypothetical protein DTO169C6_5172 [Paecilomyces variotii]KAJ9227991.1 hypothetical protein DTO166G5_8969 [Paecilomyces variotii]KAJ9243266.1 hypothetical protein DTO169E5_2848 [Paecilomyces variotii]